MNKNKQNTKIKRKNKRKKTRKNKLVHEFLMDIPKETEDKYLGTNQSK